MRVNPNPMPDLMAALNQTCQAAGRGRPLGLKRDVTAAPR